jgi:hypothetical protein
LADEAERWERLFEGLKEFAQIEDPDELQVGRVNSLLGSVHLIQPFKWTSWNKPFPEPEEIPDLSLVDCIKQITRISRFDRTNEGILWEVLRSGALEALCRTAHERSGGQIVGPLSNMESTD